MHAPERSSISHSLSYRALVLAYGARYGAPLIGVLWLGESYVELYRTPITVKRVFL